MVLGGVPFYWGLLERGLSAAQNIDYLFFAEDAPMREEYEYLFASIFRHPKDYLQIIQALAKKKKGLTRGEILESCNLTGSGIFSQKNAELESCGFLREYHAFWKKNRDSIYQLTDPFVLFYHHFLTEKHGDPSYWSHQLNTPAVNTWAGLAFEMLCLLHLEQIKMKLGISGILTDAASFVCKEDPEEGIPGAQIDLVLWRADRTVNLFEMRYTNGLYAITRTTVDGLRRKADAFRRVTKSRDAIHWTFATPYGITKNAYAGEIQSQVIAEELF